MKLSIIFLLILITSFSISQNDYEKVSQSQRSKSKNAVQIWIKKNADSIGMPQNVKLDKLIYSPDEITMGRIDSVVHFPSSRNEILQKQINKSGCYQIKVEYTNLKNSNPQEMDFILNEDSKITGIKVFESGKMIKWEGNWE